MQSYVENFLGKEPIRNIEPLAKAGSERKYTRIYTGDKTYIVCESSNIRENESFLYFSKFFKEKQLPLPEILFVSPDKTVYIVEDLGNDSLLDTVVREGHTEAVLQLYKKSLDQLIRMQLSANEGLDFSKCYAASSFDREAVLADLNYFKYYFLDLHKVVYNKIALNAEFEQLAKTAGAFEPSYFMFRDFQGRNIMIKNNEPFFIDYQGGMKGPLQYDVASLLWQAKAKLPAIWKKELMDYYKKEVSKHIMLDEKQFDTGYSILVLVRLLQVLGAYGLRGLIEQRAHFLSSIPSGLANISEWRSTFTLKEYPELDRILQTLEEEISRLYAKQNPLATENSKLNVLIQSFSYKQGIPEDISGNGGGFVFDCRGILNPGRIEEYKKQTGRDQPVIDYLESQTKVDVFLKHVKGIIDISVQDYLERGFENLMISFGCTGGQHRSVYCTDAIAKYLKETYNLTATVRHIVQEAKNWVN